MFTDCHTHTPAPGAIASGAPEQVRRWLADGAPGAFSVGIHPWATAALSAQALAAQLSDVEMLARCERVVAIGEAGFDRLRGGSRAVQREAFLAQAKIAEAVGKPLVLHVVKDIDDVLAARRGLRAGVPWIWHGFRGNALQAAQIMRSYPGIYLSFGEKFNKAAPAAVVPSCLLVETDESALPVDEIAARVDASRGSIPGSTLSLAGANLQRLLGGCGVFPEQSR